MSRFEAAESETDATRRTLLKAASAASLTGALSTLFSAGATAKTIDPRPVQDGEQSVFDVDRSGVESVYPQSVSSGDPTPSGVVVWTRLDPAAYENGEPVGIEVATDEDFYETVYRGVVPASAIEPEYDYTVNVDLDGKLDSDRFYFYRFVYDGDASRTGRCRTLPEPDASPDSLRIALATCNNYLHGYYGAFGRIAEEDVDYLVHVGDLIYEYAGDGQQPGRDIRLPSGNDKAFTLSDFRHLHRTYRSDELMQRALERHTLVFTWDDHEIVNNRWWNYDESAPETKSHPYAGQPEKMRELYVAGMKALSENLPLRIKYDAGGNDEIDETAIHDQFKLYRNFRFGDLVELFMTDERLYRSPPPEDADGERRDTATPPSTHQDDPDRTMLGRTQRQWFTDGVVNSKATWKVWGNEVLNAGFKVANAGADALYLNYDAWDGYEAERKTIMGAIAQADVENFVALSGDMHTYIVSYLEQDYKDATQSEYVTDENRVGVEFMTPAITSNNLAMSGGIPPNLYEDAVDEAVQSQNPHIQWFNSSRWGYSVVEFTDDHCTYTAYDVDRTVDSADAPKTLLRAYRVPEGEIELQEYRSNPVNDLVGTLVEQSTLRSGSSVPDGPDIDTTPQ